MQIGQNIKRLRKERNFTQEGLAEQLNISPQAVSKWENGFTSPDISQLLPLVSVFGVSADVLLGIDNRDEDAEVERTIAQTDDMHPTEAFPLLREALKSSPCNKTLLRAALSCGVEAVKLHHWAQDGAAAETCAEVEREAELLISLGDVGDALTAHAELLKMYNAIEQFDRAAQHVKAFPNSVYGGYDLSYGQLAVRQKIESGDFVGALAQTSENVFSLANLLEGVYCARATAQSWLGRHAEVIETYEALLALLSQLFGGEHVLTHRRLALVHTSAAQSCLQLGDEENCLAWLEKCVEFHTMQERFYDTRAAFASPILRDFEFDYGDFLETYDARAFLLQELSLPWFKTLNAHPRFVALLKRVERLA